MFFRLRTVGVSWQSGEFDRNNGRADAGKNQDCLRLRNPLLHLLLSWSGHSRLEDPLWIVL